MKSEKTISAFLSVLAVLFSAVSCKDDGGTSGSSSECYFFQESFSFNVTSNPEVEIPVVRLRNIRRCQRKCLIHGIILVHCSFPGYHQGWREGR